jgi:RNA 2',3'-cyclic 3'-phosphodiesterase
VKRLFIAIDISDEARRAAAAHIEALRRSYPRIKASWVRPENLHITVKFLGDTPESRIAAIVAALGEAAGESTPFEIQLSGTGNFGKRVLFIGTSDDGKGFDVVHQRVEAALERLGSKKENRAFRPHITIARIRDARGATELINAHNSEELPKMRLIADGLTLYGSTLGQGGSQYTTLARISFGR